MQPEKIIPTPVASTETPAAKSQPAAASPESPDKSKIKTPSRTTVNLSNILKVEQKKEQAAEEVKTEVNQPYTPEQLRAVWDEFAEQRKKFQAEYQLLQQAYDLVDNQIIIHIHHPVQDMMLNNLRLELGAFIRERLNNSTIQIIGETKIAAGDDKKKLFTSRDKFDYLAEKNPVLKEMKDRLGLDTDF